MGNRFVAVGRGARSERELEVHPFPRCWSRKRDRLAPERARIVVEGEPKVNRCSVLRAVTDDHPLHPRDRPQRAHLKVDVDRRGLHLLQTSLRTFPITGLEQRTGRDETGLLAQRVQLDEARRDGPKRVPGLRPQQGIRVVEPDITGVGPELREPAEYITCTGEIVRSEERNSQAEELRGPDLALGKQRGVDPGSLFRPPQPGQDHGKVAPHLPVRRVTLKLLAKQRLGLAVTAGSKKQLGENGLGCHHRLRPAIHLFLAEDPGGRTLREHRQGLLRGANRVLVPRLIDEEVDEVAGRLGGEVVDRHRQLPGLDRLLEVPALIRLGTPVVQPHPGSGTFRLDIQLVAWKKPLCLCEHTVGTFELVQP